MGLRHSFPDPDGIQDSHDDEEAHEDELEEQEEHVVLHHEGEPHRWKTYSCGDGIPQVSLIQRSLFRG